MPGDPLHASKAVWSKAVCSSLSMSLQTFNAEEPQRPAPSEIQNAESCRFCKIYSRVSGHVSPCIPSATNHKKRFLSVEAKPARGLESRTRLKERGMEPEVL